MLVIFQDNTTDDCINKVGKTVQLVGGKALPVRHNEHRYMVVHGCNAELFADISCIKEILNVETPYQLANRALYPNGSTVHGFGGDKFTVIAGPCSVESAAQFSAVAQNVRQSGATLLRGGAYKPRTSPYSFQGLGEEGLKIMSDVSKSLDMPLVSELLDPRDADTIYKYVDIIQIGTRNALNFPLLKLVGQMGKPVLLKRGLMSTVEEFLTASEYILSCGNFDVVLCERGIRTFENSTRNTLDISAVPLLKKMSHLPVVVDPSHAAGVAEFVAPLALAAVAAGADGVMVEVHNEPAMALSDKEQALSFDDFATMMGQIKKIATAVGKTMA